jgi:hypothetical protein
MKSCRQCGSVEQDNAYICSVCQHTLPFKGPSTRTLQKALLTIVIPIVVWEVMTRLLNV